MKGGKKEGRKKGKKEGRKEGRINKISMFLFLGESNNKSCWIGKKLALILFFHIPVGILLFFNTVALILTILSIRKVSKVNNISFRGCS